MFEALCSLGRRSSSSHCTRLPCEPTDAPRTPSYWSQVDGCLPLMSMESNVSRPHTDGYRKQRAMDHKVGRAGGAELKLVHRPMQGAGARHSINERLSFNGRLALEMRNT